MCTCVGVCVCVIDVCLSAGISGLEYVTVSELSAGLNNKQPQHVIPATVQPVAQLVE